jgi:small GTP-binding protein
VPYKKKICMIGVSSVGKTSLIRRFVHSDFSDKWLTTVGVRVDKKPLLVNTQEVELALWDMQGKDDFAPLNRSQLSGASGYLLVADGTRKPTLERVLELHEEVQGMLGAIPAVLVVNKCDLTTEWELTGEIEQDLRARGWTPLRSSAKTGEGVEEAFQALSVEMLRRDG